MTLPLLELDNLEMHFSTQHGPLKAVDGVSLTIHHGETLGLVGESGCGKSTLARALIRLYRPTGGRVVLDGVDITKLSVKALKPHRKKVQMIFQDPVAALNGRMTAGELVAEPLEIMGIGSAATRRERVAQLLDAVGLGAEASDRFPHSFSGGQRQRVGIARAIALEPDLVICDEPISALDVSIQAQIVNMLSDLKRDTGLAYLFITHDLSMLRHIADRIGVMYLGKLVEIAPSEALHTAPRHPYTELLWSAIPVPDPAARRDDPFETGEVPSPLDLPTGCRFRTRCPQATELCAQTEPSLITQADGHAVACHHPLHSSTSNPQQERENA
ncbi:ABC transporter ATP-binding protein [Falsihalocynthiibacter arcticus]|uniref:Peptide ABC transporter ATP-binding protein n=1 Tax=Falsihalocynthiibacter arcticus TaxID=1579316 RepID=A0A126V5Q5_9RHOB|nr:oligopeptide/dipeptide ABC transporter ATP-binding protein [Falsihalocynthiibacter arcticus]AML53039.1 peptide ABC transporter ATP-binding protein [Falsihalocynthiibacter arcticus]